MVEKFLALAAGSILGGFSRYFVGIAVHRSLGGTFPWGTLLVNLAGCFLAGAFAGLAPGRGIAVHPHARLLFLTGFCGAFTTFSAWMLETSELVDRGAWGPAWMNLLVSVAAGFLLFRIGTQLGRLL